jgi:hypothetical protein
MLVFRRVDRGPAPEDMAMMEEAVERGGDSRTVTEQFSPIFHGEVGGQLVACWRVRGGGIRSL